MYILIYIIMHMLIYIYMYILIILLYMCLCVVPVSNSNISICFFLFAFIMSFLSFCLNHSLFISICDVQNVCVSVELYKKMSVYFTFSILLNSVFCGVKSRGRYLKCWGKLLFSFQKLQWKMAGKDEREKFQANNAFPNLWCSFLRMCAHASIFLLFLYTGKWKHSNIDYM